MKLRHFTASSVFGYLRFDLKLNDSLTLLVGPNGSGKSTVLQLMEGLITPSMRDLASTEFVSASIEFEEHGAARRIAALKGEDSLTLAASWIEGDLVIPELGREKSRLLNEDARMASEYFRSLSIQLSSNAVFKAISDVSAPVFLGIERRHRYSRMDEAPSAQEQTNYFNSSSRRAGHVRRILRGNLAAGLTETIAMVQDAYRDARRRVDSAQVALRNEVLLSAFMYSDLHRDEQGKPTYSEWDAHLGFRIDTVRKEVESALQDIGLSAQVAMARVDPFFDKLELLLRQMATETDEEKSTDVTVEFLMNKGQLDRLQKLIGLVQNHKKKTDISFGRIHAFTEMVNWFFSDSGKRVSLDVVGSLEVKRQDGVNLPLDALSSGERQLLIIFSHLFFNSFGSRSKVFVIDEPELSLHLRWQENLISKIREISPEMQLVFATHSPDIVGENDSSCVLVGVRR